MFDFLKMTGLHLDQTVVTWLPWRWSSSEFLLFVFDSSPPGQNGRYFADDIFWRIFWNENVRSWIQISLKFVPNGPIDNKPELVQVMAWRRTGDKRLPEPVLTQVYRRISAALGGGGWVNSFGTSLAYMNSKKKVIVMMHFAVWYLHRLSKASIFV